MLTPLDLFTVVVSVPAATLDVVTDVMAQAVDCARQTAAEALGYTSKVVRNPVAVIPVVVGAAVTPDARAEVEAALLHSAHRRFRTAGQRLSGRYDAAPPALP